MADEADVVLQLWQEQRAQARQAEDQRATLTNIVLLVESVGLGFLTQAGIAKAMLPVSIAVAAFGIFGALAMFKYYERVQLHMTQAQALHQHVMSIFPAIQSNLDQIRPKERHRASFRILHRIRLHLVWITLHCMFAVVGIGLTITILRQG